MTNRHAEASLDAEEVRQILTICSPTGLLVGGQALAFWADHLQVERPESLVSGVTADADFIGDAALATTLGKRLGWQTWIPSLDDSTPQTGKVTHRTKGGEVKQVNFLSGVVGLTTKDLARRAIEMDIPDIGRLRVIHPVDVLDSRIQNLHLLPEKRNDAGIAQARLGLGVARAFIAREVATRGERVGLSCWNVSRRWRAILRPSASFYSTASTRWNLFRSRSSERQQPFTRCAGRRSWRKWPGSESRCESSRPSSFVPANRFRRFRQASRCAIPWRMRSMNTHALEQIEIEDRLPGARERQS